MATKPPQTIDAYLKGVANPAARKTLSALRAQLRKLLPKGEETISYSMPAFKLEGKAVAGFAFFGKNCGFYPHSGNVVGMLGSKLDGYTTSKGGVTFPPEKPLPPALVKALVQARLSELALEGKKAKVGAKKKTAAARPKGSGAIRDRVTDTALKEATGRDWKGWLKVLDAAGGKKLNHKQLVAQLAKEVKSGWWQQTISVGYEQARGLRVVGQTSDTGFQVGVQRTLPMTAEQAWELIAEHPERWLGEEASFELAPGQAFEVPKRRGTTAISGTVRVVSPGKRVRMSWHPDGWKKPATLQLTVQPKKNAASLGVHMEKLPDAKAREAMRAHWAEVLGALAEESPGNV